jgi:beta-glucosidase
MIGLNTWGDERTIRNKYLLTDVLKGQLGFSGFIVSDWYGVYEGTRSTFFSTIPAINSGVDMVMLPFDYETFIRDMKWANRLGLISTKRIDDAVSRILYAKFSLGLFDDPVAATEITPSVQDTHAALAREAVAQSLVLLKNESAVLPLTQTVKKIHVAGSAADNVGRQLGAWSIEWQGIDGNMLPGATSILGGIKEVAGANTQVLFDEQGQFSGDTTRAEVGIAVVGESPYAEGWGDNPNPTLSEADKNVIKNLKRSSDVVIVVLITGRPLIVTDEITDWDALVVAWLPGSEGAGIADVLFGNKDFTGTLPLPWPVSIEQLPISPSGITKDTSDVLFPRYFGLTY